MSLRLEIVDADGRTRLRLTDRGLDFLAWPPPDPNPFPRIRLFRWSRRRAT